MDHLKDAETHVERAIYGSNNDAQLNATLAIAHALIAIAERMPPPAEPWSGCSKRLQQEEQDEL